MSEIIVNWILAFIGILLYFIIRYDKRSNKEKPWSFQFWAKDNWPELLASILFTIAFMLIVMNPNSEFSIDFTGINEKIPYVNIVSLPVKMIISFLAGLINSKIFYSMFKTKSK